VNEEEYTSFLPGHFALDPLSIDCENVYASSQKQGEFAAALGIPIKKADAVPRTFAIPAARKSVLLRKPPGAELHSIEPTIDDWIYAEILRVIQDTGTMFERLPSTYADKDEETLRDHLLMVPKTHFQMASATGETFNKLGKTDILIRYKKRNVFVAECKFWSGQKSIRKLSIRSYRTLRGGIPKRRLYILFARRI
jgi:hypothetical protein